ncbi:MAG TPA: hypothetical protein VGO40_12950 [Longimicrobium sp.]|jgi:hypothetical protein|nr:hypothetical protein [Longimicrobium sp.]
MTDRIQSLIDAGRLAPDDAEDDEIAGLWASALEAMSDAGVAGTSASGRLIRAYDAGRLAAFALVRSRNLRVRASNHHEMIIAVAGMVGGATLTEALDELDRFRKLRNHLEYGWERRATNADAARALAAIRHILEEGARTLVGQRPTLAGRVEPPS